MKKGAVNQAAPPQQGILLVYLFQKKLVSNAQDLRTTSILTILNLL